MCIKIRGATGGYSHQALVRARRHGNFLRYHRVSLSTTNIRNSIFYPVYGQVMNTNLIWETTKLPLTSNITTLHK